MEDADPRVLQSALRSLAAARPRS